MTKDLIGKKYPVRDIDTGQITSFKTITEAVELENATGIVISLKEDKKTTLLIGIKTTIDLINENYNEIK